MSITNEQKQAYLKQRRYLYAASPTYHGTNLDSAKQKDEAAKKKRKQTLLDYLNQTKKSAIKRGMYQQNPYKRTVSEAGKNV